MDELDTFMEKSIGNGMCREYRGRWADCKTKKQAADMGLSAKAIDWVCAARSKEWGLTGEAIRRIFGRYVNGSYLCQCRGYTSEMYCRHSGHVRIRATATAFVDCDVDIEVPVDTVCEIYASGDTSIRLSGGGSAVLVSYGGRVAVTGRCARLRTIQKTGGTRP